MESTSRRDHGLQRLFAACLKPWELAMFGELLVRLRLHAAAVTGGVS